MLKVIYKFLLVSLLSGCLLLLDFSYKVPSIGFNSAQAETVKLDSAKDGDLMSTLTMSAIGLLTQRLWKCKLTTDMMIAAAAGAAYVAGEILASLKLKKAMEDLTINYQRDNQGRLEKQQIAAFEKLKKSYQEALNTANTKKNLQMAAAAAFIAAAISAGMQYMQETSAEAACRTALATAANSCASMGAAKVAAGSASTPPNQPLIAQGKLNIAGGSASGAAVGTETTQDVTALAPKPSAAADATDKSQTASNTSAESSAAAQCPLVSAAQATCTTKHTLSMFTKGVCMVPPVVMIQNILATPLYAQATINFTPVKPVLSMSSFFKNALMSEARADLFSPLGIASSAAISFVLATSATLGVQIDTMLFSPLNRAMIWGVLAGLVFMAVKATENQIGIIQGNIAKIDAILNGLYALDKGVEQANNSLPTPNKGVEVTVKNPTITDINKQGQGEIDFSGQGGTFPCVTGKDVAGCTPVSTQLNDRPDLKSLPDVVQSQIGNIGKMADGVNGTSKISSGSLSAAASLGAQQNALRAELTKQQKLIQDTLKNKGSKINLAKRASDFESSLKAVVQSELDNRKMSAGEMYASLGGAGKDGLGLSASDAAAAAAAAEKAAREKLAKERDEKMNYIAIDPDALMGESSAESGKKGEGKDAKDAGLGTLAADEGSAGKASDKAVTTSMDDYALKNDITQDKSTSLWELISNRYQKSGYPRLFKRMK